MAVKPLTAADYAIALGSAAGCAVLQTSAWGTPLPQFVVQYALVSFGLAIPAFLAVNALPKTPPRLGLRWQLALFLVAASFLAGPPWNSPAVGALP